MSQKHLGSVFTTVSRQHRVGTIEPSGTALIEIGSLPPCSLRMCSHPARLKCGPPMCALMIGSAASIFSRVTTTPSR